MKLNLLRKNAGLRGKTEVPITYRYVYSIDVPPIPDINPAFYLIICVKLDQLHAITTAFCANL